MRTILAAVASVAGMLAFAPLALADGVRVDDLGQPGAMSTVPQPALSVDVRGSCPSVRTVAEADGGASACPAGTWPEPGGDWSPRLGVAGGDTLALTFEEPQTSVAATITSNFPVGLMAPGPPQLPGQPPSSPTPVINDSAGAISVAPTDDPHRWLLTLPALEIWYGGAVAVVAQDAGGSARDVAFAVDLPRFPDASHPCGNAFYTSATDVRWGCALPWPESGGAPTVPSINPPVTHVPAAAAPALRLVRAPHVARAKVTLALEVSAPGSLTVRVGKRLAARRSLHAGKTTVTVTLRRSEKRARLKLAFVGADGVAAPAITRTVRLPR
jgi:hypothetical protein